MGNQRSKTLSFGLDDVAKALAEGEKALHPMLREQLSQHVGSYNKLPEEVRAFIEVVNDSYKEMDDELSSLETSLQQSSRERRQASDALQAVFRAMPDLLMRLDSAGRVIDMRGDEQGDNPLRQAQLRHMASSYLPEPVQEPFQQAFERVRKRGEMEQIDFVAERDEPCHYEARLMSVGNGEVLVLMRDITSRVEAERSRARHAEQQARTEAMSQFAYIASHDLRAPLRAIENLATWIEEDIGDHVEGDTKEHLQLLRKRVTKMDRLLEGLLEYSRVGRAGVALEDVDTGELVRGIADMLGPPAGFTIVAAEGLPKLRTARDPLERVLLNLITNAIKHHDRDEGRIEIRSLDEPKHVTFRVIDDGPGIPADQRERAFEMFQTVHGKKTDGAGMGLALIRRIVENASGTIVVKDRSPRGCVFEFTWPKTWRREESRSSWLPPSKPGR
jgi:signal transduction histidine kinase